MSWFENDLSAVSLSEELSIIKCLRTNTNSEYTGYVKLFYPDVPLNKFVPLLGIDKQKNVIENTNSFLIDRNFTINTFYKISTYDSNHNIFRGLQVVLNKLPLLDVSEIIEEPMFLLFNSFSGRNIGHDLSILFHRIHVYKTQKLTIPIVIGEIMLEFPFSLSVCKLLLPDAKIYILKKNTVVEFTNLFVTHNIIFDITLYKYLHKEVIDRCILKCDIIDKYKNKKICLLKNTLTQKNIVTTSTAFYSRELIQILEKDYNYIIINPETIDPHEFILYMYFASKILVSYGAIMYGNAIFFSPTAKLYYISLYNWPPYYDAHRYTTVHIANSNLDIDIPSFIKNIEE